MEMSWIKQQCDRYLDEHLDELWEISRYVHANPELAYEEYKACKVQCDYLKKMGFEVVEGAGNVPTALRLKPDQANRWWRLCQNMTHCRSWGMPAVTI